MEGEVGFVLVSLGRGDGICGLRSFLFFWLARFVRPMVVLGDFCGDMERGDEQTGRHLRNHHLLTSLQDRFNLGIPLGPSLFSTSMYSLFSRLTSSESLHRYTQDIIIP